MTIMQEQRNILWHSSLHILAVAVKRLFPGAKLGNGQVTDEGFFYDFDDLTVKASDLTLIQDEMEKIIDEGIKYENKIFPIQQALNFFRNEPYKLQILQRMDKNEKISLCSIGDFYDICSQSHINNCENIGAIKLLSIGGAYWMGNPKNQMFTRISGIAFETHEALNEFLTYSELMKKHDHRVIGKQLELFSFHPQAPGSVFWHENGLILRNLIISYWRKAHRKNGFREISTPILLDSSLWKQSGHWDHYKQSMYTTKIEDKEYAIKPMSCPGSILYYLEKSRSYRDLPLKVAELGLVHRNELSGTLHGLMRVRQFIQDDAHIFICPHQLSEQIQQVIKMSVDMIGEFGFRDFSFAVSVRSSEKTGKYLGNDEQWERAEANLKSSLEALNYTYCISEGDAKFYGPSIDIMINDCLGRKWQCSTLQLDFNLPQRFELEYTDVQGKKQTPLMLHRTLLGSLERFIGILLEHTKGQLPLWLSPIQAAVIPISSKYSEYGNTIFRMLEEKSVRAVIIDSEESLSKRIRQTVLFKIPYIVVLGEREVSNSVISVRKADEDESSVYNIQEFIDYIKKVERYRI